MVSLAGWRGYGPPPTTLLVVSLHGNEVWVLGLLLALVESSTFYGAVAKGAAAGNLLVGSETERGMMKHRLVYDLIGRPTSQLVEQWPSLPDATTVISAAGEQLLTTIQDRLDRWFNLRTGAGRERVPLQREGRRPPG